MPKDIPMRYKFLKSMIRNNINEFKPTDVRTWLSIYSDGRKVYYGRTKNKHSVTMCEV